MESLIWFINVMSNFHGIFTRLILFNCLAQIYEVYIKDHAKFDIENSFEDAGAIKT